MAMGMPAVEDAIGGWTEGRGPLYRRLADAFQAAVERGDLAPGASLPPERVLARSLAVSRSTVVGAYGLLEQAGLLERRQGSGTRVRSRADAPTPRALGSVVAPPTRNALVSRVLDDSDAAIDFVGGYVVGRTSGLPPAMFEAAAEALSLASESSGYAPLGYYPLREAIAALLTRSGLATATEQVLVTNGAQQAISLVATLYVQRGDSVVVEDPTYAGALDAFAAVGARLVTVPTSRVGVDVERLQDAVARVAPKLIYLIPSFHNPTGGVLPAHRREEVARLAQVAQVPIVDDEALQDLVLDGRSPPPPLASFAADGPILTLGSLSKLFWAGLRVGWIRADAPTILRLGRLKAAIDLGSPLPSQVLALRLLQGGASMHERRRRELAERRDVLERLLAELLPAWTWEHPTGGLCLWARLPHGDARELARVAAQHGVSIVPGPTMSAGTAGDRHVRLPFGRDPDVLREGVTRLAQAWAAYTPLAEPSARPLQVIV